LLDTLPEQALDDLTALAAHICETPIALISLVDEHRQWFKSKVGFSVGETLREISFCGHAILGTELFIVPDTASDERFADNPLVTGDPGIRFYAGAPLITPEGEALGALCIIDRVPRQLKPAQLEALRVLGRQVMNQLDLRNKTRELIESENQLSLYAEHSPAAVAMFDRDMKYLVVSRRWREDYRMGDQPVIGRSHYDVFPEVPARWRETHQRCLAGAVECCEADHFQRTDGRTEWIRWEVRPWRQADGAIGGLLIFSEVITARKQAEESVARLATAVEQSAETIVITDLLGRMLYVNPAFETNTGYTREEALGQNPRILKSGRHDAGHYRRMWEVLQRGEVWSGHFINRRKNGSLFEEEATISPVRDASGQVINYVAVKRDVTREKQLETQFHEAQKMEAIGRLAGGIAHDFNNILAGIFGYGYLLQQDTMHNATAQEDIAQILKAATRAKDLVQQILTFSRQREQNRRVITLDNVIKEALKFLRASISAEIKIELQLADDAPAVLADATQIYQVTLNLATNALDAMEGKPGRLTVSLQSFHPDEVFLQMHPEFRPVEYARLTVGDTGRGMEDDTLERIYEPFFTTKPFGKGTGLGLAVVHGIVKSHEGIVTVESEVGRGTNFSLYFPAQNHPPATTDTAISRLAAGRGQKILLLDDEPTVIATLQRLLERLNYEAISANHGRQAIALFLENPPRFDLVITDLAMPEMNGLEVARQIHQIRPDLPIVLMSGYAPDLDHENLRLAGIGQRLDKPISLAALAEMLQRVLAPS
jgi:PAS domain S-box-containing protein